MESVTQNEKQSIVKVSIVEKAKEIIDRKYMETLKEMGESIVVILSEKYKFDAAEALGYLELEGTEKMLKERERGRPKKEKKTQKGNKVNAAETAVGDDLIATLIAEAEETITNTSSETESVAESVAESVTSTSTSSSKKVN